VEIKLWLIPQMKEPTCRCQTDCMENTAAAAEKRFRQGTNQDTVEHVEEDSFYIQQVQVHNGNQQEHQDFHNFHLKTHLRVISLGQMDSELCAFTLSQFQM
jgi:hypothetical protein